MNKINKSPAGFFKFIVLIIIGLALLYYFRLDIRGVVDSVLLKINSASWFDSVKTIWSDYLVRPIIYLWQKLTLIFLF